MEQLQKIVELIKDYGAALISTISVGGVAAVAGIIAKVKAGIDKTKEQINQLITKKEESSQDMNNKYSALIDTIQNQNLKIDELTKKIDRIEK